SNLANSIHVKDRGTVRPHLKVLEDAKLVFRLKKRGPFSLNPDKFSWDASVMERHVKKTGDSSGDPDDGMQKKAALVTMRRRYDEYMAAACDYASRGFSPVRDAQRILDEAMIKNFLEPAKDFLEIDDALKQDLE